MNIEMKDFVRERDEAFRRAVLFDDWDGVYRYMVKYGVECPRSVKVLKAGVYKAVRECRGIGEDVKALAAEKALAMGMSPSMFEVNNHE